jgi:hypothetical protein
VSVWKLVTALVLAGIILGILRLMLPWFVVVAVAILALIENKLKTKKGTE